MIFNRNMGFPSFPIVQFKVGTTTYEAGSENIDNSVWKVRHDSSRTLIWLRCDGTFTFKRLKSGTARLFLCGPGANGGAASCPSGGPRGGDGGAGGGLNHNSTISYSSGTSVAVEVNTTRTKFGTASASKGAGSAGGRGGWADEAGEIEAGSSGSDGTYAWRNDSTVDGILYGAGGGGGMGAAYVTARSGPYAGGSTGGCKGLGFDYDNPPSAIANTGGGGGGGCNDRGSYHNGLAGATGVVIVEIVK